MQRENYKLGKKVRFSKMRDARLWSVGDAVGVIIGTQAYGPSETMVTVDFGSRRVYVAHVLLELID